MTARRGATIAVSAMCLGVSALGWTGCAGPEVKAPSQAPEPVLWPPELPGRPAAPTERPGRPARVTTVQLGRSVLGRPIEAVIVAGERGCVVILGGIHGDEPSSSALVERLVTHLKAHPEDCAGRTVVLIPRANPDGLAAGTRWNARGVDVNRNFSTRNFTVESRHGQVPLSEPESRALVAAIARYQPSCVISVHGPLNCIDADGGARSRRLADEMARVSPLPVKDLPAHPGSLGSYAGTDLSLQMVTYELDRKEAPTWGAAGYLGRHLKPLLLAIAKCELGGASADAHIGK